MSQSVKARSRVWSLVLSALTCISGISWAWICTWGARISSPPTGGGANVLAAGKGEDLLCGDMPDRYPWPTSPTTLTVEVVAAQDIGWVVVEGLDASGTEDADSVRSTGAGLYSIPGTWWRVNLARLRSDSTNTATINVLAGSTVLATIPPPPPPFLCGPLYRAGGQAAGDPQGVAGDSGADLGQCGLAGGGGGRGSGPAPRGRLGDPGPGDLEHPHGEMRFVYPPTQWDLGPLADLVVPAGSTGASTLVESRMQFETR